MADFDYQAKFAKKSYLHRLKTATGLHTIDQVVLQDDVILSANST